jgi:hypothetical protein
VEGEILIKGSFKSSGSLRVGDNIEALEGLHFSGSSTVKGNIFSKRGIKISGSTTIQGNVSGVVIDIGVGRVLGSRGAFKHPVKVYGNVIGNKTVNLVRTFVEGDVKGRYVILGKNTEIIGKVYYVDTIEVHEQSRLNHAPIQISAEKLDNQTTMNKQDLEQDKYLHCPNCAYKIDLSNPDLKFCTICGFNIEQALNERGLK